MALDDKIKQAQAELLAQQMLAIGSQPTSAPSPRMARAAQLAGQREAAASTESASMLRNLFSGATQIPGSVYEYGRGIAQSERPLAAFGEDVSALAGGLYEGFKQDPVGFTLDMAPIVGEIRSAMESRELSNMANEAAAAGDTALADRYRQLAAMAAAGAVPFGGIGARGAKRSAMSNIVDVPPGDARAMLNELPLQTGASELPTTAAVPEAPVPELPPTESSAMLTQLDEIAAAPTSPESRLTPQETEVVTKSVGEDPNKRQEALDRVRQFKQDYSTESGWAPIDITGITYNKAGRPEIVAKKIPYNFQKPPEGVSQSQWEEQLSNGLVSEVNDVVNRAKAGDEAALGILQQANWYRSMRDRLRSEFGGIGDVFADVLGTTSAQTGVEQNFKNATEILRRFSRGEFDNELNAYQRRIDQGLSVDGQELTALHKAGEFPLITSAAGKLFNSNSPSSMGALLNMFRSVKQGSSPKTPNFTGNLIGLTNEATIDVWAARILRRLSGQPRIPPLAEKGVAGKHLAGSTLTQPVVGQEFGFGQDVFRRAADTINENGTIKSVVPELGNLGPDDLQAVAWFMEKERWTDNGWTSKAGEGGSLDFEMSLAGAPDQGRVYDLRRAINAGFKAPAKRKTETDLEYEGRLEVARREYDAAKARNQAELAIMEAPLQRYQLGVSGERPNRPMSNYAQAELAAPFDDAVRNDPSVLTYNLANTYGSFMGQTERALNAEFVTRANFDPQALVRRLVEQGKQYDQDAVFFSKIVPSSTPNARPGVEIYFKESVTPEQMAKATERLRQYGVDGFTYVTDMRFDDRIDRQTRTGSPETAALTGLRFQYVPEFDDAFDPARAAEIYKEKAALFQDIVSDTIQEGNVSDSRLTFYDTQVFFRNGYDDFLRRTATDRNREARGELPGSTNAPQPDNGREVGAELPEPVRNGGGQAPSGTGSPGQVASQGTLGAALTQLNITPQRMDEWRSSREGMRQEKVPQVQQAAEALREGKISTEEYQRTVQQYQPIKPLAAVQKMPTVEEIAMALGKNAEKSPGIVGVNVDIPDGTRVASRLDIPAYEKYDTWVVSLHDGNKTGGNAIGYGQAAVINDVDFMSSAKAALNIATGKSAKGTIARMYGSWENRDPQAVAQQARDILSGKAPDAADWAEVGMNPFRHSYFYRKSDGMPVASAEQVIQVGPLVLAKKPVTRPVESPEHEVNTPEGPRYFKKGGNVERVTNDNRKYF